MKDLFQKMLCIIGLHNYEIELYGIMSKGDERLRCECNRTCLCCKKIQSLERPKKYHPTKYIWANV